MKHFDNFRILNCSAMGKSNLSAITFRWSVMGSCWTRYKLPIIASCHGLFFISWLRWRKTWTSIGHNRLLYHLPLISKIFHLINWLLIDFVDYIRTFTWDKKLEHIVKKGLGSGLPTIVSPEQYKARFCNAMKKYFLQSPNQWEDLDKGLICNISPIS